MGLRTHPQAKGGQLATSPQGKEQVARKEARKERRNVLGAAAQNGLSQGIPQTQTPLRQILQGRGNQLHPGQDFGEGTAAAEIGKAGLRDVGEPRAQRQVQVYRGEREPGLQGVQDKLPQEIRERGIIVILLIIAIHQLQYL